MLARNLWLLLQCHVQNAYLLHIGFQTTIPLRLIYLSLELMVCHQACRQIVHQGSLEAKLRYFSVYPCNLLGCKSVSEFRLKCNLNLDDHAIFSHVRTSLHPTFCHIAPLIFLHLSAVAPHKVQSSQSLIQESLRADRLKMRPLLG